jgi:hypothetical protein
MTNEEAKAVLIKAKRIFTKEGDLSGQAIDVAIQALSDGWIRVEDGLPDIGKQVSMQVTGNSAVVGYRHSYGHWIIQSLDSAYRENSMHKVTHWQPLPEKPKI